MKKTLILLIFLLISLSCIAQVSVTTRTVDNIQPHFFKKMTLITTKNDTLKGFGQLNFAGFGVYFANSLKADSFEYKEYIVNKINKILLFEDDNYSVLKPITRPNGAICKKVLDGKKIDIYIRVPEDNIKLGYILKKKDQKIVSIHLNDDGTPQKRMLKKLTKFLKDDVQLKQRIKANEFDTTIENFYKIVEIYNSK